MKTYDKLIFELSCPGRKGYELPADNFGTNGLSSIPGNLLRKTPAELPEVSELDVVRHFTNLSNKNFGVDTGFYPLGSCTMKYNRKSMKRLLLFLSLPRSILCRIPNQCKVPWKYTGIFRICFPIFQVLKNSLLIHMPEPMESLQGLW